MYHFFTFGGLRVERDGQILQLPTQKARELLAYLITFRHRPHPRPVLAGALWPNHPEERARRHLSDTLWRTRRAVGEYAAADEEKLWFNTALPYWLDAEELEHALATCQEQPHPTRSSLIPGTLQTMLAAVDLYRGPYLDGMYHDWVLLEQERLRAAYLCLLGVLQEQYKQAGDYATALTFAQRVVATEPLHEAAHRELIRLYHLLGRDSEAVSQYQRCREILQKELQVDPAPETEALYSSLLRRANPGADTLSVHLPAPVYRLLPDLDRLPTVGHEEQRQALLGHLEGLSLGQGGIVLLEGEAGIGKTRLAQEIAAGARWRNISTTVASAVDVETSSYALFLSALRPLLTPLRIHQLTHLVEPLHLQAAAPLIPCIAHTLPDLAPLPELPPPQARRRLQRALIALVLGLARIAPHLWVLDDIHWADTETLTLLLLLHPHLRESRALFLLTGRNTDLRASAAVWDILQSLDRIAPFPHYILDRLRVEDIHSLVRDSLEVDVHTLTQYLAQESEGVPLYIVEILKAWRDEGYLQPTQHGLWQWRGESPFELTPRLGQVVIGRRLSRLSPAAEQALAVAAVIGTEVDFDLLTCGCSSTGVPPPDLAPSHLHLLVVTEELLQLNLLIETDRGYRFSHEHIRWTVYKGLSDVQRQQLHRGVALAIEGLYPNQYELLAHHFEAAGDHLTAIHYLIRAARRAREIFAHPTALACFDHVLELLSDQDLSTRWDILYDRAQVLGWIGDRAAHGRDLDEMIGLAHTLSDPLRLAHTLQLHSEWHRLRGEYSPAEQDAREALKVYRRLEDKQNQAAVLSQLGYILLYTAGHPQAMEYFEEALSIHRALDDCPGQIHCLIGLASAADLAGNYALSLHYGQQCMALAEATGSPHYIGRAHFNAAVNCLDLGDSEAARVHLHHALHLSKATGDRRRQGATHLYLGVALTDSGNFQEAEAHLDTALQILREVQDTSWEGDSLAAMGRLALSRGDPAVAERYLQAAYQRRLALGEPAYAAVDLSYLALAELAIDRREAAWQHSRQAVGELERGLPGVEHPQRIYYNHYLVAEATGHWTVSRKALDRAGQIVTERSEGIDDLSLREKYLTGLPSNQAIAAALHSQPPPGNLLVRLACAGVPSHRRPLPNETVTLTWTVDAGQVDADLAKREGRVALRRQRILRLLAEADRAGAAPTVADLAGALEISSRVIRTDLAALRHQGHPVRTRGQRS